MEEMTGAGVDIYFKDNEVRPNITGDAWGSYRRMHSVAGKKSNNAL
jgi:hypothetical protein